MQTLLQHLAAKKIYEDSNAAEKDAQAQIEKLKNAGVDRAVSREITRTMLDHHGHRVRDYDSYRSEREQVNPQPALRQKILADLQTQNGRDLVDPQSPLSGRSPHLPISPSHPPPPSPPIRYS